MSTLARWDPFRELADLRADMDRLFARPPAAESRLPRRWAPAADVIERDDAFLITAELPGVTDADVHITVHDGVLRIAGERHLQDEVDDARFHRIERSYGAFERTFTLPPGVEEKDIHAAIAYGVLRITIPRAHAAEPRRIPVAPTAEAPVVEGNRQPQ